MKKYHEWLEKKGYGEMEDLGHRKRLVLADFSEGKQSIEMMTNPTKQMFIGYMMEYLMERGLIAHFSIHPSMTIDEIYYWLEEKIKKEENYFKGIGG